MLQTSSVRLAHLQPVSLIDRLVDLAARHGNLDSLGVDAGVGEDLVTLFQGLDAAGMSGDRAFEDLAGASQSLGVVHVGMSGHDQLAGREAEVHLPDQLEHIGQLVQKADVDQRVLGASVDQVDVDTHPAAGLVVHLDHAGEHVIPFDHREVRLLMHGTRHLLAGPPALNSIILLAAASVAQRERRGYSFNSDAKGLEPGGA